MKHFIVESESRKELRSEGIEQQILLMLVEETEIISCQNIVIVSEAPFADSREFRGSLSNAYHVVDYLGA